jgi:DNA-binding SARP family transcriptional activator
MSEIFVTMLGHFDIFVEGSSALSGLAGSSKSMLVLKFLLLSRGKSIPVSDLLGMFWSEPEKSANPESALKTMISRIRFALAAASPLLKNCILSENKAYMWNPEIDCEIDVFLFEQLSKELEENETLTPAVRGDYMRAISLYGGDLSSAAMDADWIVSRSMYLHHLYLRLCYRFIALLKEADDYGAVIHVCRIALDVDAFDETLNLEMMNALAESGQNASALVQYRHVSDAYQKYLGTGPSERIQDFYKNLLKAALKQEADLQSIRQELKKECGADSGAFICDYSIFRDIYELLCRNLERQDDKMFLALVTVSPTLAEEFEPLVLDGVMRDLLGILRSHLRRGDVVARYSAHQYAALLPMAGNANGSIVFDRIEKAFYQRHSSNLSKIAFQFGVMD